MTSETATTAPAARPTGVRLLPSEGVEGKPVSLWRTAWRRLFQRRSAMVGMAILALLIGCAIFAPLIAPYDPDEVLLGHEEVRPRDPPCIHLLGCPADQPQHWMGIDSNVRDEFSRVLYGARYSLVIGFVSGVAGFWGVNGLKKLLGADDSLDVFGVHGVCGIVGALLTGVFAAPSLGGSGIYDYVANAVSPEYSIWGQVVTQATGVLTTVIWSGVVALIAYKLVDLTIGLRVPEDAEREGLDTTSHGEAAYRM